MGKADEAGEIRLGDGHTLKEALASFLKMPAPKKKAAKRATKAAPKRKKGGR